MKRIDSFIIGDLKYPLEASADSIATELIATLNLPGQTTWEILRRSMDARDKGNLRYVWQLRFRLAEPVDEMRILKSIRHARLKQIADLELPATVEAGPGRLRERPVVVGSGPAGLFCAFRLAERGLRPIVLERGRDVDRRAEDVESYWSGAAIDPTSNVQFGEGGAGTFSDGKLTSRSKSPYGRKVLEIFADFGANADILWKQRPHIGTDVLREVVKAMRLEIVRLGGEFRFETQMLDLLDASGESLDLLNPGAALHAVQTNHGPIPCEIAVLALGHSARDSYRSLIRNGLETVGKPFAIGMRIEHPQEQIDLAQYGAAAISRFGPCDVDNILLPAEYQLTHQSESTKRGVYTFCMCPGGLVVESSSGAGQQVVNGMSYRRRDQVNANSALLCMVGPDDYGYEPESALLFQEDLERRAWLLGQGLDPDTAADQLPTDAATRSASAPVQLVADYMNGRVTTELGDIEPSVKPAYRFADLNRIFPDAVNQSLKEALRALGRKLDGFDRGDAVLTAVESRTSSPLRLMRNKETLTATRSDAIYPIGEGSGYAGGIVSSAVDGLEAADAIVRRYGRLVE